MPDIEHASTAAMTELRLIWPVEAMLGEGPAWFAAEAALRFVDIKRGCLHRYDPDTGAEDTLALGGQPSFVLPASDGSLIVGSDCRILAVDPGTGSVRVLAQIPMPAHNRTNDATVDRQGRLWFGTMDDAEHRRTGALWCMERGRLHCLGGDAVVTNGPAITRDGRTLYHVDSVERIIWRHAIGDGPTLHGSTAFLQLNEADGHPDGIVVDSEDCLWVALWDGGGVRRYAPDGTLLLSIALPCARVTKLALGGPDLRTAYVTTARTGLGANALAAQPLAGALFAFTAPAAGMQLPAVQL